jgi:hypothetical protein
MDKAIILFKSNSKLAPRSVVSIVSSENNNSACLLYNGYRVPVLEVNRPGCDVEHPSPSSVEVPARVFIACSSVILTYPSVFNRRTKWFETAYYKLSSEGQARIEKKGLNSKDSKEESEKPRRKKGIEKHKQNKLKSQENKGKRVGGGIWKKDAAANRQTAWHVLRSKYENA